jgi:regulator of protease activity HflC (stomatin/prohibitin superfamily)
MLLKDAFYYIIILKGVKLMNEVLIFILVVFLIIVLRSVRQVEEYERGVKFQFGKFYKIVEPGWHIVWPIIQSMKKVDIRTKAVDVPEQDAITRDNVSVRINAVLIL